MTSDSGPSAWWSDLKVALGLLTRYPVHHETPPSGAEIARASRLNPLVGALIGLVGGLAFWLAHRLGLPPLACGLVAVGATVLVTGARHEAGLGEVAEGFGGAPDEAEQAGIGHERRIGTYGTLAVVLSVGLRAAALASLAAPGAALAALVGGHAAARAVLPAVMRGLPLARSEGLAAGSHKPEPGHARLALALGALFLVLALGLRGGVIAILVAAAVAAAMASVARNQIGGYTGDVLGAVEQCVETAVLLAAAAAR